MTAGNQIICAALNKSQVMCSSMAALDSQAASCATDEDV